MANNPQTINLNSKGKSQSKLSKVLDLISAPLSKPKVTFTKGIKAGAAAVKSSRENIAAGKESGTKVILTTLGTTAAAAAITLGAAGASAGAAGIATRSAATTLGKGAIQLGKSTATKAVTYATSSPIAAVKSTAVVGLLASGAAVPIIKGVYSASKKAGGVTKDILSGNRSVDGNLPSIGETAGTLLGAGALGYAVGKGAEYLYDNITGKENTPQPTLGGDGEIMPSSSSLLPVTPQTQTLEAGSTPKRRKSSYKPSKRQNGVNQSVRIVFDNDKYDYKGNTKSIKRSSTKRNL